LDQDHNEDQNLDQDQNYEKDVLEKFCLVNVLLVLYAWDSSYFLMNHLVVLVLVLVQDQKQGSLKIVRNLHFLIFLFLFLNI
jgi:hypothetical protein